MSHENYLLLWGRSNDSLASLEATLSPHGFAVRTVAGGGNVLAALDAAVDLVVLDVADHADLRLIPEIRTVFARPIVVMSSYRNEQMLVRAFEHGADDVVARPFRTDELLARIRALLRRYQRSVRPTLEIGPLSLDWHTQTVYVHRQPITTTATEYALLTILAAHPQRIFSTSALLRRLWGENALQTPEKLLLLIQSLRIQIEADPQHPTLLRGDVAQGFYLADPSNGYK